MMRPTTPMRHTECSTTAPQTILEKQISLNNHYFHFNMLATTKETTFLEGFVLTGWAGPGPNRDMLFRIEIFVECANFGF